MADSDPAGRSKQAPIETQPEPPGIGKLAAWLERTRILRTRVEKARARHASIDVGFCVVERDASIGGGLLAGALAYRIFVLLIPTALLFVSGIGLYASAADKSATEATGEAGLHGLIASQVASTASGQGRAIVFVVMIPVIVYALAALYRAIAITHALVWHGSGRGVRTSRKGVALLGAAVLANILAAALAGWARGHTLGSLSSLLIYLVFIGGAWLPVSTELPHRDVEWTWLLPGALLTAVGLLLINVFNVYVTTRLVEDRANTYGALGIATALLFSLVLVGRLIVVSAELNATIVERHRRR
jgi:uncharacterized BrkB/YihY/UPF0761 family membrane protein